MAILVFSFFNLYLKRFLSDTDELGLCWTVYVGYPLEFYLTNEILICIKNELDLLPDGQKDWIKSPNSPNPMGYNYHQNLTFISVLFK